MKSFCAAAPAFATYPRIAGPFIVRTSSFSSAAHDSAAALGRVTVFCAASMAAVIGFRSCSNWPPPATAHTDTARPSRLEHFPLTYQGIIRRKSSRGNTRRFARNGLKRRAYCEPSGRQLPIQPRLGNGPFALYCCRGDAENGIEGQRVQRIECTVTWPSGSCPPLRAGVSAGPARQSRKIAPGSASRPCAVERV